MKLHPMEKEVISEFKRVPATTLMKRIPAEEMTNYLNALQAMALSFSRKNDRYFDMDSEVRKAIKLRIITEDEKESLLRRLQYIKENANFKREWLGLKRKWASWFFPEGHKRVCFGNDFIDLMRIGPYFKLFELKHDLELLKITLYALYEIGSFLERHRINAVRDGTPFVRIFSILNEEDKDYAGRSVLRISVPPYLTIRRFQRIATIIFSRYRKDIAKYEMFNDGMPKAGWGERTGKKYYYQTRDEKIVKMYKRLKKSGLTDEEINFRIFFEYNLEKDMTEFDSIKPVIDRYKKTKRKE